MTPCSSAKTVYQRTLEPRAVDWRNVVWTDGAFDAGRRPDYTEKVEGTIRVPQHLVLVTVAGGARRLEVAAACGHRYAGPDRPGAVSFVPADCERRLQLWGVRSRWASISLRPALLDEMRPEGSGPADVTAFTNVDDPFLASLLVEMERLCAADGALDPSYCDAMSSAVAHHLVRRYAHQRTEADRRPSKLAPWQLRRISEYIDANIEREIRIAELAAAAGLSSGYLHRAFRVTTGLTPLAFVNRRRVERAIQLLVRRPVPIAELSLRVGFASPSHFTRTFRRLTGSNPSAYRSGLLGR